LLRRQKGDVLSGTLAPLEEVMIGVEPLIASDDL
jgi:hypothetical protein